MNIALFAILAFIAEVAGTVGGFGSSLFFVPIAGYFLEFHAVLGVTAAFHVFSNISKIWFFHSGFNRRLILTVGIPAIVFVIVGAFLSSAVNGFYLQIILGIFLIVLSSILLLMKETTLKPTLINSVTGGALSGFAAGLVGSGGAIRGLTLAAFNIEMTSFIATSAAIDLGVDLSRTVVYVSKGYLHENELFLVLLLLVISVLGTYAGKRLLNLFTQEQFRVLVLSMVLVIGVFTVFRQLFP